MTNKAPKNIIILHETMLHSIAKDVFSCAMLLATIGVGVYIDSGALQWCAGIFWIIWIFSKSVAYGKNNAFSFDEARAKIDALEEK